MTNTPTQAEMLECIDFYLGLKLAPNKQFAIMEAIRAKLVEQNDVSMVELQKWLNDPQHKQSRQTAMRELVKRYAAIVRWDVWKLNEQGIEVVRVIGVPDREIFGGKLVSVWVKNMDCKGLSENTPKFIPSVPHEVKK